MSGMMVLVIAGAFGGLMLLIGFMTGSVARDPHAAARRMLGDKYDEAMQQGVVMEGTDIGKKMIAGQVRMMKIVGAVVLIAGALLAFGIVPVDFIDPIAL